MQLTAEEYAYLVVYAYREVRVRDPNAGAQAIEDLLLDLLQGAGESVGRSGSGTHAGKTPGNCSVFSSWTGSETGGTICAGTANRPRVVCPAQSGSCHRPNSKR
ncbi:MAG: hypothetical protein LC126_04985 [Bryobacterales bacterium]|nr:hypothetical protein [Bryobacterales bacterium]